MARAAALAAIHTIAVTDHHRLGTCRIADRAAQAAAFKCNRHGPILPGQMLLAEFHSHLHYASDSFPDDLMAQKFRSPCPIATTLDLVGDRWTLVILRDLLTGKSRYSEFLSSPEKITTNILADRLERMERAGLITKAPYQQRPVRHAYALTEMGRGLHPMLREICHWANRFVPETWVPPESFMADR